MDFDEPAPAVAAAPTGFETDASPPPPTRAEPQSDAATPTATAIGPIDGDNALRMFGHYAEGDPSTETAAPLAAPPPAPGVICGSHGIDYQEGDSAYAARGIAPEDVAAALADPAGKGNAYEAMQRARARRELGAGLEVVPDGYSGPRNPNTVTEAEYAKLSETYMNIRMGRGDLTINTDEMCPEDAIKYRDGAMKDIATMMQTKTGRDEIAQLADNRKPVRNAWDALGGLVQHRHTTIKRFHFNANGDKNPDNDDNQPLDATNNITYNRMKENEKAYRRDAVTPGDGTDATIRFNPGITTAPTTRSDISLAHEMAHAIQITQGLADPGTVNGELGPKGGGGRLEGDRGVKRQEHQATGIGIYADDPLTENAYRRERHTLGVKGAKGERADDTNVQRRESYITREMRDFD
jgi:hypothetical protein